MGHSVTLQRMYTTCPDKTSRTGTSIISNAHPSFVLGTFKPLFLKPDLKYTISSCQSSLAYRATGQQKTHQPPPLKYPFLVWPSRHKIPTNFPVAIKSLWSPWMALYSFVAPGTVPPTPGGAAGPNAEPPAHTRSAQASSGAALHASKSSERFLLP